MDYGFYGIFGRHDDPGTALALASEAIAKETGCNAESSRNFLESYQGRLFAEGVIKELERLFAEGVIKELKSTNALKPAIDGAVAKLTRHTISLPYLKGFLQWQAKGGHWGRLAALHLRFCVAHKGQSGKRATRGQ
jgi:hypothetical protein